MQNFPKQSLNKSFQCPKCGSEQTNSLEAAYKNGVREITPPVLESVGAKDYLIAGMTAVGTFIFGGIAIGFFGTLIFGGLGIFGWVISILLTVILPIVYLSKRNQDVSRRNSSWRQDMKAWQNSWVCLRCGNTWLIKTQ